MVDGQGQQRSGEALLLIHGGTTIYLKYRRLRVVEASLPDISAMYFNIVRGVAEKGCARIGEKSRAFQADAFSIKVSDGSLS